MSHERQTSKPSRMVVAWLILATFAVAAVGALILIHVDTAFSTLWYGTHDVPLWAVVVEVVGISAVAGALILLLIWAIVNS